MKPTPSRSAAAPADTAVDEQAPVNGGREVFDLDAAVADALADPFPFTYGGDPNNPFEWEMMHPGAVDYRDAERADGGDIDAVRKVIATSMGASVEHDTDGREYYVGEQWEAFDELAMPSVGLDRLFRAWLSFYGIKPGEFSGSVAPSVATAAPSNRASRRAADRSRGGSSPRGGGATWRR